METESKAQRDAEHSHAAIKPIQVLICDDEPRLTQLTAALLEQRGVYSETANQGEAALGLAQSTAFCVLLLDVQLAGMSALELLERLDARGIELPVLLVSGYLAEDIPQGLYSHQRVQGFLTKPYAIDDLLGAIQRIARCEPHENA